MSLRLHRIPGRYAVARLEALAAIPPWAGESSKLISITRTADELSIVTDENRIPPEIRADRGWAALAVEGPLDFALTGILAKLTTALAAADVTVFAISTFDTDVLLVRGGDLELALAALGAVAEVV